MMSPRGLWHVGALMALGACASDNATEGCQEDSDCRSGFFCQASACYCRTDDACEGNEYCNASGSCQTRPACIGNQDCSAGTICNSADPTGGVCIPASSCGSGLHCPFNQFCNPADSKCTPGCRSTGDCELGKVCAAGSCVSGQTANDCSICPANPDPDSSYCDYGEFCSSAGQCQASANANELCTDCTNTNTCNGSLVCLIDPDTDNSNYCAPSCVTTADCPAGYSDCSGLSMVFEECDTSADCSNGGECRGRSESNRGFCACTGNQDCDQYSGICTRDDPESTGTCFLAMCDPTTPGSCSHFGSGVQCSNQLPYLCRGLFGDNNCTYTGCEGDDDCTQYGAGVSCQGGICTGASCENGVDCICANNRCVLNGSSCTTGADCLGGICTKSCASDMDCMCLGGRCLGSDLPCQAPSDCAINCEEGSCITSAKACGKESGTSCSDMVDGSTAQCRQY